MSSFRPSSRFAVRRLLAPLLAALVLTALPVAGQYEAAPSSIRLGSASPRARVLVTGPDLETIRRVLVVDRAGSPTRAVEVRLGAPGRDGLPLELALVTPRPGTYGLLLDDGRRRLEVKAELVVEAAESAPPRIEAIHAPDRVEVGQPFRIAVQIVSEVPLAALEFDWGDGPRRIPVAGSTAFKDEVEIGPVGRTGRRAVRVEALTEDGVRSDAVTVDVEVAAPLALAGVSVQPSDLGPGSSATVTVRLSAPAAEPVEVALEPGVPAGAPPVDLPPSVTVPPGSTEASVPLVVPTDFTGAWSARVGAGLEGGATAHGDWTLRGVPGVASIEVPDPVLDDVPVDARVNLDHAAPPGGVDVRVTASTNRGPWTVRAPAGATEVDVPITLPSAPGPLSLTASTPERPFGADATLSVMVFEPAVPAAVGLRSGSRMQESTVGRVVLDNPAPYGGVDVALSAVPSGVVSVPATVAVPGGVTSAEFPITLLEAPTAAVTEVRLRASALGAEVEGGVIDVYPAEAWVESLEWFSSLPAPPAFVEGDEVVLRYQLTGYYGQNQSWPALEVAASGPGDVRAEPGDELVTQPSGLLHLTVVDVEGDGDLTVTATVGGATASYTVPVTRPSLAGVRFTGPFDLEATGEATYPDVVRCRFDWSMAAGLTRGDLSATFRDTIHVTTDRPDLLEVPPVVEIRPQFQSTETESSGSCTVSTAVTEPTPVQVTGTLNGSSVTAELVVRPTAVPLHSVARYPATNDPAILGDTLRLLIRATGHAHGQPVALTSSDPDLLQVPTSVVFEDGSQHVARFVLPVPEGLAPPFPRNVTLTAEMGGVTGSTSFPIQPRAWLADLRANNMPAGGWYPGEPAGVLLTIAPQIFDPTGYAVTLSTDRPDVFEAFPTGWSPGESLGVGTPLGTFTEGGAVEVRATDGTVEQSTTLDLAVPTLDGFLFLRPEEIDSGQGWFTTEWQPVTRLDPAAGTTTVDLQCAPAFAMRQPFSQWTSPVQITTNRPDLIDLPATIDVTFRGQGSDGVADGTVPCTIDVSSLTAPTSISVTVTYGSQTATSTLDLAPAGGE